MKQDVADSPAPSWSEADDDAILDSIDDVMWDELRGLSTPQTPRGMSDYMYSPSSPVDVIRGASPVHSPALQVQTLQSECSPIRGEDQDPVHQLSTTLQFGMNPAQYNAIWASQAAAASASAMAMPMMDTPMSPALTWTSVKAEQMQCDPPNPSAMERRRQKNRDCMRRARQRQRDELNEMKATVARLEKQYAELSLQSTQKTSMQTEGALATRMASDCAEAAELSRRLGAENLYLKAEIQQKAEWKISLSRILQSTMEVDGPRWAQQFQQPSLGGEAVLRMRLDERDRFEAREEFGFHPLTDLGLTQVILDNRRTISRVQSRLLVPSSFDTDDGARTRRVQIFGWDMAQRVHGNIMECVFTKKFRGLNVSQLMQKTWANDMRLGEFKKVKGETSRLEVLQQVNPNAYVLARDVMSPTEDISTFRSVFVRFLIETSKKIPLSRATSAPTVIDASAPSTPPQYADSDSDSEELMLNATGYVLGTQSFDTDYSRNPREEDIRNKVAWAHLSLSIEFLNVVNPVTGEEYQQLRWSGRTDYCGPKHAQRNASDMMQGMLRWEMLVIAPALNLVSLSIE
ncbi:hypothetical protein PC129_g14643 [Phytophthora cactorum]|uniref:BZIP domain-containing protein n=3 Tax=Phytophthora cactorum TaxID=29920 RepID=A0A329RX54_9STRA|nr:hypothetical protein Pcac1_g23228 [Phytophthora cactorum]KAG2812941.1 hypothetical protein PC112_g14949 [Phytophthora cactorum]KAG2818576.1 hypothetical protein PC111_g12241 [Phytophthora cactorum]KAG2851932.1 hypothetical protein PC113_g15462 [Phytophthora cactorum]KAG2897695.1 hypothetical protein PC114_g14570 [Phytophthora cactorum]